MIFSKQTMFTNDLKWFGITIKSEQSSLGKELKQPKKTQSENRHRWGKKTWIMKECLETILFMIA